MVRDIFIEIDQYRFSKHDRSVNGDVTLTRKLANDRVVSILCDGLGSGVEANVLASFTASMGIEYMEENLTITRTAELIMDALPLCPERKISYSTFSIADLNRNGDLRLIEHGNPPFLLFRHEKMIPLNNNELYRDRWKNRRLQYAQFQASVGDRVILMSDGVTQSGLGSKKWPMGCGYDHIVNYTGKIIEKKRNISASELSKKICENALENDCFLAGDDITCLVMYIRKPRVVRILTGPPVDPQRDLEFAWLLKDWDGKCAICGGTTANIVERELGRKSTVIFDTIDPVVPVTSEMENVDLVTEGCITLSRCAELLENKDLLIKNKNGAVLLRDLLLTSDIIEFYVGTRINQAHQDPDLPVELDIRRNMIKKICTLLQKEYLKETIIRYF
jgi:hypothetical protein